MNEGLARFQEQLLAALADGTPTGQVLAAAADAAPDEDVAQWVASWEPDLVELAGVLVRTWAHRAPEA